MIAKPRSISTVGIVQFFLAASFVVWLIVWPSSGTNFAWPITPVLSAMFIGTSFILRTFLGYHLWHETQWYRLRWIVWGNYTFLGVLWAATLWHADQMNWKSNILVAHIWVVAYMVEPLILALIEPRDAASKTPVPPELSEGPVSRGMQVTLAAIFLLGLTVAGLLFLNPAFTNTRWPWPLDAFDARIMAAWPAACAVWAATMYHAHDWAEIKMGVQALLLYSTALFVFWAANFGNFAAGRANIITFGVATGLGAALLAFFYWRQEAARRKAPVSAPAAIGR